MAPGSIWKISVLSVPLIVRSCAGAGDRHVVIDHDRPAAHGDRLAPWAGAKTIGSHPADVVDHGLAERAGPAVGVLVTT